jgi:Tol biopolymer transport system component
MNWDGSDASLLLDCGADRCFEPALSPDGKQIAYSRKNGAENPGGGAGISRIWLIDPVRLATSALYADARIAGMSPSWSPDGRFLAFYNPREGAIQIHALDSRKDRLAATQVEGVGGWSPDSQRMIFAGLIQGESSAAATLSQIDVRTGEIRSVLPDLLFVDFGEPVFNPDGERIAVAARSPGESSARHVWVFDINGADRQRISEDALQSQGGYHWDPEGRRLVYQQLLPGNASQPPDVFVYDLSSRTAQRIAQDAFLPNWLPVRP